jgi:glycolate oxidase FAD binding subunit
MEQIVGAENRRPGDRMSISGSWPVSVACRLSPGSAAEVSRIVAVAEAQHAAIVPYGAGTLPQVDFPLRTDRPLIVLCTERLNHILDYQPDDMTVTVEPGVTLAALQERLSARRQFLALDVPYPERATIGGIVAAGASGLWRSRYGGARDLLIGMRAVTTGGTEIKGGGKVVKNVAGYDVCKLFTGSRGTLGVLTELTFKVGTRPEVETTLRWSARDIETACRLAFGAHQAQLAAVCLLVVADPGAAGVEIFAGLHGASDRLSWQESELTRLITKPEFTEGPVRLSAPEVHELGDRSARQRDADRTGVAAVVAVLPTDVEMTMTRLRQVDTDTLWMLADVASGVIAFSTRRGERSLLREIRSTLPPGANLRWTRMPAEIAPTDLGAAAALASTLRLHRALKQALDPLDTFCPGALLGSG